MATRQERAIEEARRRAEAATDPRDRIYWRLIGRAIETGSALDQVGQIVDETGKAWHYVIVLKDVISEFSGHSLPVFSARELTGDMDAIMRYNERTNDSLKLNEHQQKLCTDRICQAMLAGV